MRNRGASAVALVLLVLAQLGAMSHAAAVRHVRCAAHDELIEAAVVDAHPTDATRLVGVRTGAGADEHCELAAALHPHATTPRAPTAVIAAVQPAVAELPPLATVVPTTVYVFAPKTSPPDRSTSLV